MYLDVDSAAVVEVFIGGDERGGIYLEAEQARATFRGSKDPPLEVRGVQGQMHLLNGLVNLDMPTFELPGSRASMIGTIDLSGDRPMYDLAIEASEYALSDLRWLFPWFPAESEAAHGSGSFTLQDEPLELIFLAREFLLEMPGSRVTGSFGLVMGIDSFDFFDVDLEADPLDVADVERLLPEGLPVSGLEIGGATIE
jgi:hypothetical protein